MYQYSTGTYYVSIYVCTIQYRKECENMYKVAAQYRTVHFADSLLVSQLFVSTGFKTFESIGTYVRT